MFTRINPTTKKAAAIVDEWTRHRFDRLSIHGAYGRPSSEKVSSYEAIERRAYATEGYNHDLTVTGAGSHFYSTVYSFTDGEGLHIVKDTKCNTFEVVLSGEEVEA